MGNNGFFTDLCGVASIGKGISDTEAALLSDALKSNTTLTQLNLSGEHKRNNTQMTSPTIHSFFILIESTGNMIGDTGATSLSDALKSNTTLTELNLFGEYKRNNTHK